MSLHMEEFLDVNYVEQAIDVLGQNDLDILFGNLSRTQLEYDDIQPILDAQSSHAFNQFLHDHHIHQAYHWKFTYSPIFFNKNLPVETIKRNIRQLYHFGFRKQLRPTTRGYTKLGDRYEDVHIMKREFAERYNWFLRGHTMYLYDIHICEQPVICELSKELQKVTPFPLHFNRAKVYHINHGKLYYQFEDEEFTTQMLKFRTNNMGLQNLQKAIRLYQDKTLSLKAALQYTRKNQEGTGTQNLDYIYHTKYLNENFPNKA